MSQIVLLVSEIEGFFQRLNIFNNTFFLMKNKWSEISSIVTEILIIAKINEKKR